MANVCVITGGGSGLGYDMAAALAEYGCRIVITSRQEEKAAEAAKKLSQQTGAEVIGLPLDQRSYPSCEEMARRVMEIFGRIDILINNAGGGIGFVAQLLQFVNTLLQLAHGSAGEDDDLVLGHELGCFQTHAGSAAGDYTYISHNGSPLIDIYLANRIIA